jgi:oxygen-independent coproporphyrinogen-3 oxidase
MPHPSQLFAARVPRYTSYPTAPHFNADVDEGTYRTWLKTLPAGGPVSFYLHIPFCDSLCWFCGCHTKIVNHYGPVRRYCDDLIREIALVAEALPGRMRIAHLHWGGGSPTMLTASDIQRLMETIRHRFDLSPDAECAIEIDPRGFTAAMARQWADAGINRASIGLQDSDPKVQKAINRIQSEAETRAAVEALRAVGVRSINLDLLYGLPHQTAESWAATLAFALSLDPDRLAVFGYAHMPSFKKHQALIAESALPGIETRFAMAEMARDFFCRHGYQPVGLDHFAKPRDSLAVAARAGTLARNFQGYTADPAQVLLGLGASAIGSLPQGYVQNLAEVPKWRAALEQGQFPIARGLALSEEDRIRRTVIERLMCDLKADLGPLANRPGGDGLLAECRATLDPLVRDGIVTFDGRKVTIAPAWRAASRLVCAAFDQYLPSGAARHSISV